MVKERKGSKREMPGCISASLTVQMLAATANNTAYHLPTDLCVLAQTAATQSAIWVWNVNRLLMIFYSGGELVALRSKCLRVTRKAH